jgi:hypothetical protein
MSDVRKMQDRANQIDDIYRPTEKNWGIREYTEGMVGDIGDLMKLVMAKSGLREKQGIDEGIEHEINDIQWSILMLYKAIGKDPVESFMASMDEIELRVSGESNEV